MGAVERQLGEGAVVRSDEVEGNEVRGAAWRGGDQARPFVALFDDEGEVLSCTLEDG